MTTICAALPLSTMPAPHQLLLCQSGHWRIYEPLEFSRLPNRQELLKSTVDKLRTIGKEWLDKCADELPFEGPQMSAGEGVHFSAGEGVHFSAGESVHALLLSKCLQQHRFATDRLIQSQFTAEKIWAFFQTLQRQVQGVVGEWDHSLQIEGQDESQTRKFLECIFSFGEAPFVKRDLLEWGGKLLNLQTQIARWPANFNAHHNLDFCPREVRSLDWLATTCAYILADYMLVVPHPQFEVYVEELGRSVTYEVAERFDLVGGLWAFGLLPTPDQEGACKATPIVLVRGTEKNPFKEGFWGSWWLNADPNFPGASLCTPNTRLPGHRALVQWLHQTCSTTGQKALLVGHSLGGTISIGLTIFEHQFVRKAVIFNAPLSNRMLEAFQKIANPPEVLQFQNCRDPLCQMESVPIGRTYNLDFMESATAPKRSHEYFASISHLLPPNFPPKTSAPWRCLLKVLNLALDFFKYLGGCWLLKHVANIEPLPTFCTFFQRVQHFPNSIFLYHSVPSTLKTRCLVQRCTSDLRSGEWISVRLMFEWICRTWAFLALNAILGGRNLRRRISLANVQESLKQLKARIFSLQTNAFSTS